MITSNSMIAKQSKYTWIYIVLALIATKTASESLFTLESVAALHSQSFHAARLLLGRTTLEGIFH